MRVTGGKYIRRKILCPAGEIRPAMDRMRESMFAILGSLDSMSFLDLFSGSGIIGIEAASRGAKNVVFVEKDYRKKKTLLRNISIMEEKSEVFFESAERFIKTSGRSFDYIFLDPPFRMEEKQSILEELVIRGVAREGSIVVIHVPRKEYLPLIIKDKLLIFDIRRYGGSRLYFYHVSARQAST